MSNAIRNVEIFREGNHNGDIYTTRDLDEMVANFHALDYRPALKLGHSRDKPGAPAYGWVQGLRRVGGKLIADFTDMHDSVVNAIRNKSYDRVSAEIYFGLKRGGKVFRRAIKAVALLGCEVPAVAGLTPLHKMEFVASGFDGIVTAAEQPFDPSPGERLDELIRTYMEETGEASYSAALTAVLSQNEDLHAAYAMSDNQSPEQMDAQRQRNAMGLSDLREERQGAGIQIQNLVAEEIRKNPALNQMAALKIVLQNNPPLAEAYRNGYGWVGTSFDAIMGS